MKVSASHRTAPLIVIVALFALVGIGALAAHAHGYPPLRPGVVKVDTGNRQEDEQPPWTAKLARAGWDYNPSCDRQGARFDWFAPGQPCNEREDGAPVGVVFAGEARA